MGEQLSFYNELVVYNVFGNDGMLWSFSSLVEGRSRDVGIVVLRFVWIDFAGVLTPSARGT